MGGSASEQLNMRMTMIIEQTETYNLRVWLSEFGDALGGSN